MLGQINSYMTLPRIINMSMRDDSKTAHHLASQASAVDGSSSAASSLPGLPAAPTASLPRMRTHRSSATMFVPLPAIAPVPLVQTQAAPVPVSSIVIATTSSIQVVAVVVSSTSPTAVVVSDDASSVVPASRSSARSSKKRKGVLLLSPDPVPVTDSSVDVPAVSTSVSLVRSPQKKINAPVTPSTPSIVSAAVDSSPAFVGGRPTRSPKIKRWIPRPRANLSKTSTTGVAATSSSTSPHLLAPTDTRNNSPSTPVATAAIGLPEPLAVPYSLLRARAGQVVARKSRSTPAMRASRDIRFFHHGSARCWLRITSARSPIQQAPVRSKSFVSPTPVSLAGFLAFADVYDPSHPCQRTLALFPSKPMCMSVSKIGDAQDRLRRPLHSSHPSSPLDLVAQAWVKFRGDNRDPTPSFRVDTRSKCFVVLWERTHWILESSILMGMHPDEKPFALD